MKNKKILIAVVIAIVLIVIAVGVVFVTKNNNEVAATENVMEKPTGGMEALPDGPQPDNPDGTRPPEDALGRQGMQRPSDSGTDNPKPPTE